MAAALARRHPLWVRALARSYVCVAAAAVATSADADVAVDAADVAGVAFAVAVGVAAAFAVAVVLTVVVAVAVAVAAVVVAACGAAWAVAFLGVLGILFGKISLTMIMHSNELDQHMVQHGTKQFVPLQHGRTMRWD